MNLLDLPTAPATCAGQAFDLDDDPAYRRRRDWKLAQVPGDANALVVPVHDPRRLSLDELAALTDRITRCNVAVYRTASAVSHGTAEAAPDKSLPQTLAAQLGLHRLDANWLADEDGERHMVEAVGGPPDAGEVGHLQFDAQ